MKKIVVLTVLLLSAMFFNLSVVKAECNPKQCNDPNDPLLACGGGEHCTAYCCVSDGGGGSSCNTNADCPGQKCCGGVCKNSCGSGYTGPTCNPGYTLYCNDPSPCSLSTVRKSDCDAYFPSRWGNYFCGETGSSKQGNLKKWYSCETEGCECCQAVAPAAPSLQSPAADAQGVATNVNLTWSITGFGSKCPSPNVNQFQIYLNSCAAAPAAITNPTSLLATVGGTTFSRAYTAVAGTSYCWRVVATNGAASATSTTRRFAAADNIVSGTVYNDVGGTCSQADPSNLGGGLGVSWGTESGTVNADGTFVITTTGASPQSLSLTGIPASYVCSPGCGNCPTKSGTISPSTGNNFYLTQSRNPWWQAVGAGVYAGTTGVGATIRSRLPSPSTRLIIPGTNGLAALVRASSGPPDIGAATQISDTNWSAVSRYKGKRMDYQFFAANLGLTSSSPDDFVGDILVQPVSEPTKDFWYQSADAVINDPWTVNSGESYVLLIAGDLRVAANITVAPGGFLAIITDGGVTVDPSVTSLQGLYVMDNIFTTETGGSESDLPLTVQGSIVTWGGVSLNRDLGASLNVTTPAESFRYRADLITNMPEAMKVFALRWQQLSPGTFGE